MICASMQCHINYSVLFDSLSQSTPFHCNSQHDVQTCNDVFRCDALRNMRYSGGICDIRPVLPTNY